MAVRKNLGPLVTAWSRSKGQQKNFGAFFQKLENFEQHTTCLELKHREF